MTVDVRLTDERENHEVRGALGRSVAERKNEAESDVPCRGCYDYDVLGDHAAVGELQYPLLWSRLRNTGSMMRGIWFMLVVFPCGCSFLLQPSRYDDGIRCHSHRLFATPSEALMPEENPYADKSVVSRSHVSYSSVLEGVHRLFPPEKLEERTALSRTDGYWPYLRQGKEPPQGLVYGEYDFYFFAELLDRAHTMLGTLDGKVFVDIGSGTGRLVLAAAALHPQLRASRGVELLEGIHDQAVEFMEGCRTHDGMFVLEGDEPLPMAPLDFVCGSFEDPNVFFGDADVIFVFSSCLGPSQRDSLAQSIGRQVKPGSLVITTDYMLPLTGDALPMDTHPWAPSGPFEFEFAEKVEGYCWLTGGPSTALIHRVKSSQWSPDQQSLRRELSAEEKAYLVAKAIENGTLTDTKRFLRSVYNQMTFNDIPERFRPKLDRWS